MSDNESGKRETLADIVADLRAKARKFIGYHGVGWCEGGRLMSLADRIEAAWKREREELREAATEKMLEGATIIDNRGHGNAAAMREALVAAKKSIDGMGISSLDCDPTILMAALTQVCARLSARIERALSAPPRQCDVGTAEEQIERLYGGETCPSCKSPQMTSDGCACVREGPCALRWAQMPYEAKEGAGE